MDINEQIFQSVKNKLEGNEESQLEVLSKICLGTATKEEIERWNEESEISIEQLKEYCNIGHNFAENVDLKKECEELKKECEELKKELETTEAKLQKLEEEKKELQDKFCNLQEECEKLKNPSKLDMKNYSQFI